MDPPKSALGQIALSAGALFGASWLGAAINSRAVRNMNGATAAAALGAVAGGATATFAGVVAAASSEKWRRFGTTLALLGTGSFAASALLGLRATDRLIDRLAISPRALTALERDSGARFDLNVGDTLTVELPAAQGGYTWSWSAGPANVVQGPISALAPVDGGNEQHDTWTATTPGTVTLTAALVPATGTGDSIATWQATAVVS